MCVKKTITWDEIQSIAKKVNAMKKIVLKLIQSITRSWNLFDRQAIKVMLLIRVNNILPRYVSLGYHMGEGWTSTALRLSRVFFYI